MLKKYVWIEVCVDKKKSGLEQSFEKLEVWEKEVFEVGRG